MIAGRCVGWASTRRLSALTIGVTIAVSFAAAAAASGPAYPAGGAPPARLRIVEQSFGVRPGELLLVTIEVDGSPATIDSIAWPDAELTVSIHDRVTDGEALDRLDASGPSPPTNSIAVSAADVFAVADNVVTGELAVPIGLGESVAETDSGLTVGRAGIYAVTVDVAVDDAVIADALTFIEVLDPDRPTEAALNVAIMATVDDPGPWPSDSELATASADVVTLIELAQAVDGPLSIGLPPVLVGALSADARDPTETTEPTEPTATTELPDPTSPANTGPSVTSAAVAQPDPTLAGGSSAPGTAPDQAPTLVDLAATFRSDELLAAPAIAMDPSSIVAIGEDDRFTDQLRLGEDLLSTASPRAVVSRSVWVSEDPISAPAALMLRNLGIRMLVLSAEAATDLGAPPPSPGRQAAGQQLATGYIEMDLGGGASLPGLTASPLGARLDTPATVEDTGTANDRAVGLMVEMLLENQATGNPAMLLATPSGSIPDPEVTARFVVFANEMPSVSIVPISRLPGPVDGTLATASRGGPQTIVLPPRAGDDLTDRLVAITAAEDDARNAASMLLDPTRRVAWSADFDGLLSSTVDDAEAKERLRSITDDVDAVFSAIVPPEPFTYTFTGTSNTLRLRIENTSAEPLSVKVRVRSPKLTFPDDPPVVLVPANSATEVEIPVEARSNGTFTIEVDILTPDDERIAGPVILKARVNRLAGLSQVVTGGAVLVLASWWYSHLRRKWPRRPSAADLLANEAAGHGSEWDPPPPAASVEGTSAATISPDAAEALTSDPASSPDSADPGVQPG